MTSQPEGVESGASPGARAATHVGAGIFLSRILGLVRMRVEAYFFGTSVFADAWRAAMVVPNVIRNLLGEGTLSASMVPIYAEFLEEGREDEASRFAGAVLGLLTVAAAILALLGVLAAPFLVAILLPQGGPEKQAITTTLVRILFPMSGIFVISAWAMGVLDSHRRFFISYAASSFWNISVIAAVVSGGVFWGLGQRDLIVVLAWGALAGGGLQLAVQLPFVVRHLTGVHLSLGRGIEGVSEAMANFWPVVSARGVISLSSWFQIFLAGLLADGALAVMGYAQQLYILPISLFGISIAASELPEMSRMREQDHKILADRVAVALRRVSFFLVPTAIGYVVLGDIAIAALFETGEFGSAETLISWGVLGAFALGMPASASSRALSSAFYALRDTKTPARIAYLRVAVSVVIGVLAMRPLDHFGIAGLQLGAAGLAIGASCAAWLELVLLRRALGRLIGDHGPGTTPIVRFALAASIAVSLGVGLQTVLPSAHPILLAVETLIPVGLVYLAVAALLGEGIPIRVRR